MKKLVSIKEAAEMLGVTPLTLRNWDKKGKLEAMRHPINNYRVYKVEDIEAILEEMVLRKGSSRASQEDKTPRKVTVRHLGE